MSNSRMRIFLLAVTAVGISLTLTAASFVVAQEDSTPEVTDMAETASQIPTPTETGYASVNGLEMYYEIYGEDNGTVPLVLLHGGLSNIEVDFGAMLPFLTQNRRVIGIEQQAHGHTADIDRTMTYEQMADDTAALLEQIGVEQADFLGYSIGGGIALQIAIRHPEQVHKLVLMSSSYNSGGLHPGMLAGIDMIQPEMLMGSPYQESYARIAPRPEDFPQMIARIQELDRRVQDWLPQDVEAITAPALIVIADSDIIRPEHAVDMFRLFGGGVAGDNVGLPNSQLAVLPATTHIGVVQRVDLLSLIIPPFLDAPLPETETAS